MNTDEFLAIAELAHKAAQSASPVPLDALVMLEKALEVRL